MTVIPYSLSNLNKMICLELISTVVFVGTLLIGFSFIVGIVLYNIAFVLWYDALQFPALAAIYLFIALLGALFLTESMGAELKDTDDEGDEEGYEENEEGNDSLTYEDPPLLPLEEDPVAF